MKIIFCFIFLSFSNITCLIGQKLTQHFYEFAFPKYDSGRCRSYTYKFDGEKVSNLNNLRMDISKLYSCDPRLFNHLHVITLSNAYIDNSHVGRFELANSMAQADSINKFLRKANNFNLLSIEMQNPKFTDSIYNHLANGIKTIDSLILYDHSRRFKKDSAHKMQFPLNAQVYESIIYLNVISEYPIDLPDYIFKPKLRSLETLILNCDSVNNFDKIVHLKFVKKLILIHTKNIELLMPYILRLHNLEEIYIVETDIKVLPEELLQLPSLKNLVLLYNPKLKKFPKDIKMYDKLDNLTFVNYDKNSAKKFSIKLRMLEKRGNKKYNNH